MRRVRMLGDGRIILDGMDGTDADHERMGGRVRGGKDGAPLDVETWRALDGSVLAARHHNTLVGLLTAERTAAAQLEEAISAADQSWFALHGATAWLGALLTYVEAVDGARMAAERWREATAPIRAYRPKGVAADVDPYELCRPADLVPAGLRLTATVTPSATDALTRHERTTAKREQWLRTMRELAPAGLTPTASAGEL